MRGGSRAEADQDALDRAGSGAPAIGEPAPPLAVHPVEDGRWGDLRIEPPVPGVLVFGSLSCAHFRGHASDIERAFRRFGAAVEFLWVYPFEAHPAGSSREVSMNRRAGVEIPLARHLDERLLQAQRARSELGLSLPLALDSIDDRTESAYRATPERYYVIDGGGAVCFATGYGPLKGKMAPWIDAIEQVARTAGHRESIVARLRGRLVTRGSDRRRTRARRRRPTRPQVSRGSS